MQKCYVFGIGGSGTRIVKALSFLLAGGYMADKLAEQWQIVPILIDKDNQNAAYQEAVSLLRNYKKIYQTLRGENKLGNEHTFFPYSIEALKSDKFDLNTDFATGISLYDSLQYEKLSKPTQHLLDLLICNRPSREKSDANCLYMDLNVGFRGIPSIGTIILQQLLDSSDFSIFTNSFKPNDRIFIVGSVFGGTGAAGLPLLAKAIRAAGSQGQNRENGEALSKSIMGGLLVLPYFRVNVDTAENPNPYIRPDTFIMKSIAALKYYDKHRDLSAVYYLGDESTTSYDYSEGGITQNNEPHLVEFIGAMSVFDFLKRSNDDYPNRNQHSKDNPLAFEFGLSAPESNAFNLKHFHQEHISLFKQSMIPFYYLHYLLQHEKKTHEIPAFKNISKQYLSSDFYNLLKRFLQDFDKWLKGLQSHTPAFEPFLATPKEELNNLIPGYTITKKKLLSFSSKVMHDDFANAINNANRGNKLSEIKGDTEAQKVLNIYYRGINQFITDAKHLN